MSDAYEKNMRTVEVPGYYDHINERHVPPSSYEQWCDVLPWRAFRPSGLSAAARTKEGVTAMLDRMEAARGMREPQ